MNSFSIPSSWINRPINVVLLGCGGTGSEMLDELYRIHSLLVSLGGEGLNVIAMDGDTVSTANIGRQRYWSCDVGYYKAEVLINRINNFGCTSWNYKNEYFKVGSIDRDFVRNVDLLITCVDRPTIRAQIGRRVKRLKNSGKDILWLDCGNDENSGNVILGHICSSSPDSLLPNVFSLYPMLGDMKDDATASCSTQAALQSQDYGVNRSIAREAANLLWRLIRHGKLEHHGSFIDIKHGHVRPLMIDPDVWATF